MIPNRSPWLRQLARTRPIVPLSENKKADVAIVGGGIAGITSAFFILKHTNKSVLLLEADKIAHGATGHNAGQVTSYFERPLHELVEEFGLDHALEGQRSVESAWGLLDEIIREANISTPLYRFIGHAGLSTFRQVLGNLRNNQYRVRGELPHEIIFVAEEWAERQDIPAHYSDFYSTIPQREILELLNTKDTQYIASLSFEKGCMNSALFTEELLAYLVATFPKRFSFFEESPVRTVHLQKEVSTLDVCAHTVTAGRVVLCTNGFEHFNIINDVGKDIDTSFHHSIVGRIGYMTAYLDPKTDSPPTALSYYPKMNTYRDSRDPTGETYFYLTRRPFEHEEKGPHTLVSTGGPEKVLPNGADYSRTESCLEDVRIEMDEFLQSNYDKYPGGKTDHLFCWHGLMGFTPNGIRRVGPEPLNPVLLYNLGCNGVGILPSVFGSRRIAQCIHGESLEPSIFDPHDASSEI
jgi:glycine/D-amino acid oxidase-like deaminating enzyme